MQDARLKRRCSQFCFRRLFYHSVFAAARCVMPKQAKPLFIETAILSAAFYRGMLRASFKAKAGQFSFILRNAFRRRAATIHLRLMLTAPATSVLRYYHERTARRPRHYANAGFRKAAFSWRESAQRHARLHTSRMASLWRMPQCALRRRAAAPAHMRFIFPLLESGAAMLPWLKGLPRWMILLPGDVFGKYAIYYLAREMMMPAAILTRTLRRRKRQLYFHTVYLQKRSRRRRSRRASLHTLAAGGIYLLR